VSRGGEATDRRRQAPLHARTHRWIVTSVPTTPSVVGRSGGGGVGDKSVTLVYVCDCLNASLIHLPFGSSHQSPRVDQSASRLPLARGGVGGGAPTRTRGVVPSAIGTRPREGHPDGSNPVPSVPTTTRSPSLSLHTVHYRLLTWSPHFSPQLFDCNFQSGSMEELINATLLQFKYDPSFSKSKNTKGGNDCGCVELRE
jgi:hypothetical protein